MSMLNGTVSSLITSSLVPPSANDDSAGTGGNGRFSPGNRWLAPALLAEYLCISSAVGAAVWVQSAGVLPKPEEYFLKYALLAGSNGGTATAGSWLTRPLNTIVSVGGTSVTLNIGTSVFTLTAGNYDIRVDSTFFRTQGSSVRLYNVTDNVTVAVSTSVWTEIGDTSDVVIAVSLSPVATTDYRLDYQCTNTKNNNGLGRAAGNGVEEVYARVKLDKFV